MWVAVTYQQPKELSVKAFAGVVLAECGGMGIFGWLLHCRQYTRKVGHNRAIVLMEKGSDRVVRVGLQCISLTPWPFRQRFETKEYPTGFWFSSELHPITANPKVIPLSVRIGVALGEHTDIPEWFLPFFTDPALAENAFRLQAFEIFQHRLPQELANRLNPFDQSTMAELREYVERQLREALPFEIKIARMEVAVKN